MAWHTVHDLGPQRRQSFLWQIPHSRLQLAHTGWPAEHNDMPPIAPQFEHISATAPPATREVTVSTHSRAEMTVLSTGSLSMF